MLRAKPLIVYAILGTAAAPLFGLTAIGAEDREAEARRLFVEAAKIARTGPCKEYRFLLTGGGIWASLLINLRRDELFPCLKHYRRAAHIHDRILDEYPETAVAFRIADAGYLSEADIGRLLTSIQESKRSDFENLVSSIQKNLATLGYDPGPPDGVLGTRTRAAIRKFQSQKGLEADGEPSKQVLSHIRESIFEYSFARERSETDRLILNRLSPGYQSEVESPMTVSELDAIRRQIEACWNVPAGARDAENLVVDIRVVMNPDGTVRHASVVDRDRMARDSFFRATVESALRAVFNPRCNPLKLPPKKYKHWQTFTLSFNPKEMISGARERPKGPSPEDFIHGIRKGLGG